MADWNSHTETTETMPQYSLSQWCTDLSVFTIAPRIGKLFISLNVFGMAVDNTIKYPKCENGF